MSHEPNHRAMMRSESLRAPVAFVVCSVVLLGFLSGMIGWALRGIWEDHTLTACTEHSAVCDATLERSFAQTREAIKTGHECLDILHRLHPEIRKPRP